MKLATMAAELALDAVRMFCRTDSFFIAPHSEVGHSASCVGALPNLEPCRREPNYLRALTSWQSSEWPPLHLSNGNREKPYSRERSGSL